MEVFRPHATYDMREDVPPRRAMALYFEGSDVKGRQGNLCVQLHLSYQMFIRKHLTSLGIKAKYDYDAFVAVAVEDRIQLKYVVDELRGDKITKRREARKTKEAVQRK